MRGVAENIRRLGNIGKTVFVITHDPELILSCCTYALMLAGGAAAGAFPLDEGGRREMLSFFVREGGEAVVS
jgi:energy-coupling factor transport system ATP-binding protein